MAHSIAILGSGPAGLLAAHAAHICRVKADVISLGSPSVIGGAQYLHESIPDLTQPRPEGEISFHTIGDAEGYAQKVYGNAAAPTSFDKFKGEYPMWSLRKTYEDLWARYGGDNIQCENIDHNVVRWLQRHGGYDMIISSIPRHRLCEHDEHVFESSPVWISNTSVGMQGSSLLSDPGIGCNYILYNGDLQYPWYRASEIFGVSHTEWPSSHGAPDTTAAFGTKPTFHTCDCLPEVVKIGRFGKWEKGVLVNHAFQEAMNALQQL